MGWLRQREKRDPFLELTKDPDRNLTDQELQHIIGIDRGILDICIQRSFFFLRIENYKNFKIKFCIFNKHVYFLPSRLLLLTLELYHACASDLG
jgi:hypothetical protein